MAIKFRVTTRLLPIKLASAVCWLVFAAQVLSAQPFGYSISEVGTAETQLYQIDLSSGETTLVGPLGIEPAAGVSAAASPAGEVFIVDSDGMLLEMNSQTGQASLVADLPITRVTGLAFAPDGDLRIVAESEMYRVTPAGLILETVALAEDVRILAANRNRMIAIWLDQDLNVRLFAEINPETGELGEARVLQELRPCLFDAELDSQGHLWMLTNPCTLLLLTALDRATDLSTGVVEPVTGWGPGDPGLGFRAFVIPQAPAVVDIPTLSRSGLAWLILALALAGGWALARRGS